MELFSDHGHRTNRALLPSTFQHYPDLPTSCDIQTTEQLEFDTSEFKPSHAQSPFDLLPDELISLILERGYFDGTLRPDNFFRFSTVCISHRFRQISLHTPSLWSIIKVTPTNTLEQLAHLIPTYLARSMDYPLSIELTFLDWKQQDLVIDHLISHSKRWRSLSISTSHPDIFSFIQHIPVPRLEYLSIYHFSSQYECTLPSPFMADYIPKLSFLSLTNVDLDSINFPLQNVKTINIRGYGSWMGYSQLTTMLEGSQSLENLNLHVKASTVLQEIEFKHRGRSQILLPHLRSFVLHISECLTAQINSFICLFTFPKLQTLDVRESMETIISYNVEADGSPPQHSLSCSLPPSPPSSLIVRSADIYFSCLSVPSSTLTTLELHKVIWPTYPLLKEAFESLTQLRHLLLLGLDPEGIVNNMERGLHLVELDSCILVPSLMTLTIEFDRESGDHTISLLRLFSFPRLASLNLRHITFLRWKSIVNSFAFKYTSLTSLTLSNMTCIIPVTPDVGDYRNPAEVFPLLKRLSLDHIHSNAFIQRLLPRPISNGDSVSPPLSLSTLPWPCLRTLLISGDTNVSKPLLGRVITMRENLGVPFDKLYLDHHLTLNIEFWDWIMKKQVNVELIANDSQAHWWFHSL